MALDQPAQDHRLARGPEDILVVGVLGFADLGDRVHPRHDEIVQLVVDLVDLAAQALQPVFGGGHRWRAQGAKDR